MKAILKIKGMHCASCKKVIEMALNELKWINKIEFQDDLLKIDYDKIELKTIIETIKEEGYGAYEKV